MKCVGKQKVELCFHLINMFLNFMLRNLMSGKSFTQQINMNFHSLTERELQFSFHFRSPKNPKQKTFLNTKTKTFSEIIRYKVSSLSNLSQGYFELRSELIERAVLGDNGRICSKQLENGEWKPTKKTIFFSLPLHYSLASNWSLC